MKKKSRIARRIFLAILSMLLLEGTANADEQPKLPYTHHTIKGGGGLKLSVQEWGNSKGRDILFFAFVGQPDTREKPLRSSPLDFRTPLLIKRFIRRFSVYA